MRLILPILFLCIAASSALADTALDVDFGWEQHIAIGRWTPVWITLADPRPRNVEIVVKAPHDRMSSMRIHQMAAIGPRPATFVIYIPGAANAFMDVDVIVRDAKSGKKLAEWLGNEHPSYNNIHWINGTSKLIGVAGERSSARALARHFGANEVYAARIDTAQLPVVPAGFDSFDLLILTQADLTEMRSEQQLALADWVRAGGKLLFCPGAAPLLPGSAVAQILPGDLGDFVKVDISNATLDKLGLPHRFAKLGSRAIEPAAGAHSVNIFLDHPLKAYRHTVGFGQVMLAPVDLSQLADGMSNNWPDFFKNLTAVFFEHGAKPANGNQPYWYNGQNVWQQRKTAAYEAVGDRIADIKGVGKFGFSYVAIIMMGLIAVVGPVDWFVLKKMGRQPLTWLTTSLWIALITVTAVYLGYFYKSGELHLRSIRLIDQAGDVTAATSDLVGIYSPSTRTYDFNTDEDAWWQPVSPAQNYYGGPSAGFSTMDFHQNQQGTQPIDLEVPIWNLCLLEAETPRRGAPVIQADLTLQMLAKGRQRITGTITNRSTLRWENVVLRTDKGISSMAAKGLVLEPGQIVQVDVTLERSRVPTPTKVNPVYYNGVNPEMINSPFPAGEIAPQRSVCVNEALNASDESVCITGECNDAPAPVNLGNSQPNQRHWQFFRALVEMKKQ